MILNPLDYKIADLNKIEPEKGRLLIAEPFMADSYFKRSVVLLAAYSDNDVVGFILNKPLQTTLDKILPSEINNDKFAVYLGGPVETSTLHFIHTLGTTLEESKHISGNLFWGGNFEQLKKMINNNEVAPTEIMFFTGYSGWSKEQLSNEINEDSWLISNINTKIFNKKNLWKEVLKKKGGTHAMFTQFPENPSLN